MVVVAVFSLRLLGLLMPIECVDVFADVGVSVDGNVWVCVHVVVGVALCSCC